MAKVLLVDDEPDMQILVRQKFKKSLAEGKFELSFAENGLQALEILNSQMIDVLVTDVNMPGMDGITLLEEAQKSSPLTRSIIVSAYGDMETLRKAMNRGAYDFVTKPVDFKELEDVITQSCQTLRCPLVHNAPEQLTSYQDYLRTTFPSECIRINVSLAPKSSSTLANAWQLDNEHIGILLIHTTSPQLQDPLAVIVAERNLNNHISTNPQDTVKNQQDSRFVNQLCYGVLNTSTNAWSFVTEGPFQISHNTHPIHSEQTALLNLGDLLEIFSPCGGKVSLERTA